MSNKNTLKRLFGVGAFACCSAILLSVTAQSARSQQIPTVNDLGGMIGGTIRFYQSLNDEAEGDAVPETPAEAEVTEAVQVSEAAAEVRALPDFSDPAPAVSSVSVIDENGEEAGEKQIPEIPAVFSADAPEPDQTSGNVQTASDDSDWMKDAGQTAAEPEKTASSDPDRPSGSGKDGGDSAAVDDKEEKKADDDWMETADDSADSAEEELTAVASGKLSLSIDNTRHTEYLHGYEDGTARPGGKITRAEACQILFNLLRTKPSNRASLSDVKNGDWYAEPVRLLAAYSIVDTPGDKARPGDYMTRAELVSALSRLVSAESKGEVSFSDVPASHPYYDAIAKAVGLGWVNGYEDGTFKPDGSITRAEAAKVVNRALSRSPDKEWIDANVKDALYSDLTKDHWAYYELMEASVAHDVSIENGAEHWNPEKKNDPAPEEKPAEAPADAKPDEKPAETKPEEEPHEAVQPEACGWADEALERMLSEPLPEEVDASRLEFDGLELYALDEKGERMKNVTLGRFLTFGRDGRYTSGNEELDKQVKDLLKEITTEDMTREEKLRAAYEYCRDHLQYRRNNFYEPGQTGWEVEEALTMLQKKKGNCYNFAASFAMLARQLGYDAEAVSGLVGSELQAHGWVEIVADGERLFYDTILESSYKERGFDYDFFGQHYEKAPWPYHKR